MEEGKGCIQLFLTFYKSKANKKRKNEQKMFKIIYQNKIMQ